jgi:hypothetical protein
LDQIANKLVRLLFTSVWNTMKESYLRHTTQEKLLILGEVHSIGLEPTLRKYQLTTEALIRWQKKFKGSEVGNFINPIEGVIEKEKDLKSELERRMISEKEDAFLRLFASLIVQTVLEKHRLDR